MNCSLRTKTIAGVAVIEATLLAILVITIFQFLTTLLDDSILKRAHTTANLFASTTKNAFLSYDLASLETDVEELLANSDIVYVRVIDNSGNVFASGGSEAALSQPFQEDSFVDQTDDGVFDISAPIKVNSQLYGRVELGINISSISNSLVKVRNWAVSIALIEMLLVALFSFVLGTYLTSQLKVLRSGARKIARSVENNHYTDNKVKVTGSDELAELSEAFNQLADSLFEEYKRRATVETELTELNRSLEQKVQDRTTLLQQKNALLQSTNKDLKEAQVQLLQAEKMASVGQLAAGVAHEINNPVGFVGSNLSTLSDYISTYQLLFAEMQSVINTTDDRERLQKLEQLKQRFEQHDIDFINEDVIPLIRESSEGLERVSEIVKGLKLFSRIDSDEKQWFDINDCVRTTLSMVNNKLKYISDVKVELSAIPRVFINVGKISQVITNLLINAGQAIEATEKHGHIRIATTADNKQVSVHIEDTGGGIKPEHIDKLFNPFFTTKPEGQGTGLGLSISFGIAEEHGGTLSVRSDEGKGSCFTLTLPLTPPEDSVHSDKQDQQ